MFLTLLLLTAADAASPEGPWQVIETEHFRLHYPADASAWAEDIGAQLESIRAIVSAEVGYAPDHVVDVVIEDPMTTANGYAIPLMNRPRMGLWASPPPADSVIGYYRSWEEDLVVHEDAHVVHMTVPSRNPFFALFMTGLNIGPIALNAPRWVTEGYATVVEARLTGWGRPNSDGRAAVIRALAQEGKMPTYEELDFSEAWRGGSWAYLIGSAYLEWLEERRGPGSLKDLWMAMSARTLRNFDEAFELVFGDDPATLYGRFVAEITFDALRLERVRPAMEGTLWQDLQRSTGAPALSPDGEKIAALVHQDFGPPKLTVWATADDPELEQSWREELDERLEKDPQDVAPALPEAFPREPEAIHSRPDQIASVPRWTPDGEALLFTTWVRQPDDRLGPELVRWTPGSRSEVITRGAFVTDADPHPDGSWAVAVRQRWSVSQLVKIDLTTGEWTPLSEPDVDAPLDHPRISPDGSKLSYLVNRDGWGLEVMDLETGDVQSIDPLPGAMITAPEWAPDGDALIASLGLGGIMEIARIPLDGSAPTVLTQTRGGAFSPAPTPDGSAVFFLSPDAEGYDLHRAELGESFPPLVLEPLAPVTRPPTPEYVPPPERAEITPSALRLGRQGTRTLLGGAVGPGYDAAEAGLIVSDVVGRSTLMALFSWSERGPKGGTVGWGVRTSPVHLELRGFALDDAIRGAARSGGSLSAAWDRRWAGGGFMAEGGGWLDAPMTIEGATDPTDARRAGDLSLSTGHQIWLNQAWFGGELNTRGGLGATGDLPWRAGHAEATVGGGWLWSGLTLGGALGATTGSSLLDRLALGGFQSSPLPGAWATSTLFDPALSPGTATGDRRDGLRAALEAPGIGGLVWRRDRLYWADDPDAIDVVSRIGLELDSAIPAQPLIRSPEIQLQMGVACVYETPGEAPLERPCRNIDNYSAWFGLQLNP